MTFFDFSGEDVAEVEREMQYLSGRESEVVDIMLTLFSQEEVWDMRERSIKKETAVRTMIEEGRHYGASREKTAERIREKFNKKRYPKMDSIYFSKDGARLNFGCCKACKIRD